MSTITSTNANRQFSKMLADALKGRSTDITMRGKLVAKLVPVSAEDALREAEWLKHLEELRDRPVLGLPRVSRDEMYDE
jgi:antitoxin (DNA-binding transcriptional repressor) of toxin-antitoxin stability system